MINCSDPRAYCLVFIWLLSTKMFKIVNHYQFLSSDLFIFAFGNYWLVVREDFNLDHNHTFL